MSEFMEAINLHMAARERLNRELGSQDYALQTLFAVLADVRECLAEREELHHDDEDRARNCSLRLIGAIDRAVLSAKTALDEYKREKGGAA